ncbi:hypothetical protein P7B04_12825 [Sphingobium yanoikuyae]|uniref:hypothetical protein n=1 Tax=Sphingobium yanoikuyae TaxID=13690 RepID=UPI000846CEDB|nr:hypothetical protein [Sphingobium yanoikuyae]MDG2513580.1 hypothetical protein [Sphingobium yanoikuyae]
MGGPEPWRSGPPLTTAIEIRLNDATGKVDRVGGVDYTIKDGIIYDAKALRAEVRAMVARQKAERGIPPGIMTIENAEASTLP